MRVMWSCLRARSVIGIVFLLFSCGEGGGGCLASQGRRRAGEQLQHTSQQQRRGLSSGPWAAPPAAVGAGAAAAVAAQSEAPLFKYTGPQQPAGSTAARRGDWRQPPRSSHWHAVVHDDGFEGAAAAAAARRSRQRRGRTGRAEQLGGGGERYVARRSKLRQHRRLERNRAEVSEERVQLAAAQVALMREAQLQLQPIVPSWVGDPKTNCCSSLWEGVECNGAGEVVSIDIEGKDVAVPFPTSLGGLISLTYLAMSLTINTDTLNHLPVLFNTSIPSELGRLTNLQKLSLNCVSLTTQLQDLSWLSSLAGLVKLDLRRAGMQGPFPENVFVRLTRLTSVDLSFNNVTALPYGIEALNGSLLELAIASSNLYGVPPPRLFALSRLTWLVLSYNRLQGNFADMSFPSLSSLQTLNLGGNEFTGSIPATISRLRDLWSIGLRGNNLSGPIPSELFSLPQLWEVYAHGNRFTSPFPTKIGASSASLHRLDLSQNNFSGPLPTSVGLFHDLAYLYLAGNNFTGGFPDAWSTLAVLYTLDVSSNALEGSPVALITRLTQLDTLDLSDNQFSGGLSDMGRKYIQYLHVRKNRFTGPFPIEILSLKLSSTIDISYNMFSGKIPERVVEYAGVYLDLSSNNFSGPLPVSLSRMTNLWTLDVSHNQLSGSIPPRLFSGLAGLESLDLSHNKFTGQLPSLGNSTRLYRFDASRNRFSGAFTGHLFPPFLGDFGGSLDLSSNALFGNLSAPNSAIVGLEGVTSLRLGNNLFTGGVPSSVCNMTNLMELSLADNLLSGELPECLFSRPRSLLALDLSGNVLFGKLQRFAKVNSMLSLSDNYFSAGSTDITAEKVQSCDLDNNCITVANNSLPGTGSGKECVVPGKQRTARECGAFCGTVGGTQCGGYGVCQTSPASWAALERRIRSLREGGQLANSSVEAVRRSLRDSLVNSTTCQCNQDFSLQRAPNGIVTCKLASSPPSPAVGSPTVAESQSSLSTGAIVGICVAALMCALTIGALLFLLLRPKQQRKWGDLDVCRQFSAAEIARATGGWSAENRLGEGTFGTVYRGVSTDGEVWAVKRAKLMSNDFETEVRAMASLHHPRLVRLLGLCEEIRETTGHHEQILVYEFVPGGDLKEWMHGSKARQSPLSMAQRLDIVAGMADGLAYLHSFEPPIVHRDIKPANVLIDDAMQPKIADFGLLKQLFDVNDATRIAGTPGYVDPDYNRSSTVSVGSDVYSLGIVLLELLTGRNAVTSDTHVLLWAKPLFEQGNAEGLRDPAMVAPDEAVLEFCLLAMDCTRCPAMFRPSMKDVVHRAVAIKAKYAGWIERVRARALVVSEASAAFLQPDVGERWSTSGAGTETTSGFSGFTLSA